MNTYNILMILPQDFMAYHGSGIQVRNRITAILETGYYSIDLLLLPYGEDIQMKQLQLIRVPHLPLSSHHIRIGPSFKKFLYDIILTLFAFKHVNQKRYQLVYTHEEAGLIGALIRKYIGIPHIYEMHSFLPQGMCNYGACQENDVIFRFTRMVESFILKYSSHVIAISPDIKRQSLELQPNTPISVIENCFIEGEIEANPNKQIAFQKFYNPDKRPLVVYTGNMSEFQGVDILLESIRYVKDHIKNVLFLIVGLSDEEIDVCYQWAKKHHVSEHIFPENRKPIEDIPSILKIADCLVSPRKSGSNTPYKLYSYMASGKPIVATRLQSHLTAVTDKEVFLVEPEPKDMARGIQLALTDKELARQKAYYARELYYQKFSWNAFRTNVQQIVNQTVGMVN